MLGAYPIGSIYLSVNNTSPASIFGGIWEKIEDRFLLASGSSYSLGVTGGEVEHTLTIAEMPSHNHSGIYDSYFVNSNIHITDTNGTDAWAGSQANPTTANAGGDKPHNNMPPYLVVNIWKRIS